MTASSSSSARPIYDIALIGLGPAGSTLARLLDKRFSIIALDKKTDDEKSGFQKPCGGLLAPDAQKALSRFNLNLPLDVLVDPQIFSVRTIDVKSTLQRHYQRFYLNLDRHKFDLWLKSLIPETVDIHDDACCSSIKKTDKGYLITWYEKGNRFSAEAKYLVGADGALSLVRKFICPKTKIRSYMAIQQWFEDAHPTPFYSCIFDSELTDCYAWGLSKNKYFIFGGAFGIKNAKDKFEQLKEKVKSFGFKVDTHLKTEACLVLRPTGPFSFCCGQENVFLVGEAAGFISPSSLEGISFALNSAYKLSEVLNRGTKNPNRSYFLATLGIQIKLTLKCLKAPFMYFPPLRYLIMQSGLSSISLFSKTKRRR